MTRLIALLALLLAVAAVYAPTLGNGFAQDDRVAAQAVRPDGSRNPNVARLEPLEAFERRYWEGHLEDDPLYRPVTTLTFAARHAAAGDSGLAAHLANVLLHVLATALVSLLILRLGVPPPAALAGAAVFGLHAVHTEVVAAVVGRAELLAFVFGAGATLLLMRPGRAAAALAGVLFFLAFASKESAVMWVPVAALLLLCRGHAGHAGVAGDAGDPGDGACASRPVLLRAAFAAVPALLLFLALRGAALGGMGAAPPAGVLENPIATAPLGTRLITATGVLGRALWLVVAPFALSVDYGPVVTEAVSSPGPAFWASQAALLALAWAAFALRRRAPLPSVAAAVFLLFVLPTSNLFFPIGTIFGERFLYAPSLAVSLAVAAVVARLAPSRVGVGVALALVGVWCMACGAVIVRRTPMWESDEALFRAAVKEQPRSVRLRMAAAELERGAGDRVAALRHLEAAVELAPYVAGAWNNLGAMRMEDGDPRAAIEDLRSGLRLAEGATPAERASLHTNLGLCLAGIQDDGFLRHLLEGVRLGSGAPEIWGVFESRIRARTLAAGDLVRGLEGIRSDARSTAVVDLYLGLVEHLSGRFGDAAERLSGVIATTPRPSGSTGLGDRAALVLADSLYRTGRDAAARRELEALLARPGLQPEIEAAARGSLEMLR